MIGKDIVYARVLSIPSYPIASHHIASRGCESPADEIPHPAQPSALQALVDVKAGRLAWRGVKRSLLIRKAVLAKAAAGIHVFFLGAPGRETG